MLFNLLINRQELINKYQKTIHRHAVRAVILDEDRILMVQSNKGDYKFPGGGIEKGESPEEALVREVLEETGYRVLQVYIIPTGNIHVFSVNGSRSLARQITAPVPTFLFGLLSRHRNAFTMDFVGSLLVLISIGCKRLSTSISKSISFLSESL